ncbi:quinone oxidoreductase family protein [Bradyrhizobium sp. WSM471]|uniref:quinone oxidoreductase family protein n=1 Tax=Bradyrhizobium sp. WSM471 TaxID=319017 RepID=UPI0002F819F6|nr:MULTISPECIES: zinc-binding alcohol dehydrogenase family protein [Bradyrhizobium]UFW42374.1 zinc-binding alcohol dehydrogenase family protein [Bradyrhizobium canariense]
MLVRNRAAGVNNIDLLIRRGALPTEATPLPHVLGVEGAGVIDAVGPGVDTLYRGDHVMWLGDLTAGGYGPFTVIDAAYVARIAASIPFEIAAAAPVAYVTARHNIHTYGAPDPGAWILVHSAAGGVGIATLQVARNDGFRTIALTTSAKLDFTLEQGATIAIDRAASDVVEQILRVTGDQGVALSLNSVGGPTIVQDLKVLGKFGQIISFGHLGGPPQGSASDLLMPHFNKSVAIRSSDLFTLWTTKKPAFSAILRQVADDLESGSISPQIHAVIADSQAIAAHRELESGLTKGKIVIRQDI